MYVVKTPFLIKKFFPNVQWDVKSGEKTIFLTFDDGPTPFITDQVLEILAKNDIKATFFCVGYQVEKYGRLFHSLKTMGHQIGNHTYAHLDGWKSSRKMYLEDVSRAHVLIHSHLFRPPYGRISLKQFYELKKSYTIVMWDVMCGDFDANVSIETCLDRLYSYSTNGSIIVFHDSLKTGNKILKILPRYINYLKNEGYEFKIL